MRLVTWSVVACVFAATAACSSSSPSQPGPAAATTCDELAHIVADVVIERIDRRARQEDDAAANADDERVDQELQSVSDRLECGSDGWSNDIVLQEVRAEYERRILEDSDDEAELRALRNLSILLVSLSGEAGGQQ